MTNPLSSRSARTREPYKPEPDLFLKFASVDANADAEMLSFANSYGLLGGGPRWIEPAPKRKAQNRQPSPEKCDLFGRNTYTE